MKKHIIGKVLAAFVILLASSFLFTLQGQGEVKVTFTNPDGVDYGSSDTDAEGIGGWKTSGDPHAVTLEFKVAPNGQVELVATTLSQQADNLRLINSWNNTNVGTTALTSIRGSSFKFIITSNDIRMQCGYVSNGGADGIGLRGTNQRRIDGHGGEEMYFILEGEVGIQFTAIEYRDINYMGGDANFEIADYDTKEVWMMEDIGTGIGTFDVSGKYSMRYKSDTLTFQTSDTIGDNNPGGRLLSLEFNVVAPLPKPPAISSVIPQRGDSLTFTISDDIELQWDAAMDQAKTAAAITIDPAVSNRVDTWSAEADGDLLTISYDDLTYETWYTLVVSDAAEATNGLTMLAPDTIRFKTLPKPPEVIATFPENLAEEVLPNTPISIEFSKSMIPDSVEKGISFDPAVTGVSYVWSADNKTVYISAGQLELSTMYFVSVGEPAMDDFKTQLEEPYIFAFTTAIATSVEYNKASDVVIYPNPVVDILQIRGMDVASLKIYSLTGQLMKEIRNSPEVNVRDMETGIYVVSVSDREGNKIRKMVVIE